MVSHLDALGGVDDALRWIPKPIPAGVHIIVSCVVEAPPSGSACTGPREAQIRSQPLLEASLATQPYLIIAHMSIYGNNH